MVTEFEVQFSFCQADTALDGPWINLLSSTEPFLCQFVAFGTWILIWNEQTL